MYTLPYSPLRTVSSPGLMYLATSLSTQGSQPGTRGLSSGYEEGPSPRVAAVLFGGYPGTGRRGGPSTGKGKS